MIKIGDHGDQKDPTRSRSENAARKEIEGPEDGMLGTASDAALEGHCFHNTRVV